MIAELTHGWSGIALAFTAVQGPMLAGLLRERARLHQYLLSPAVAVPATVGIGVGMAAVSPLLSGFGAGATTALALGASALLGFSGGRWMARPATQDRSYRRGALVIESKTSAERTRTPPACPGAVRWAGRAVPPCDETKHFKVIGTTGAGKSTAINELLVGALARGDRAVIADPDGGYLARHHDARRPDVILNPFDRRAMRWDPFAEIREPYDVDEVARALIPDQGGAERSWRGYARTFFSAVTRQMHAAGVRDASELYRLLVVAEPSELRTLLRGTPAQPFLEEHNTRMFDSIRSVASSALGALEHVARQGGERFSVRDWIDGERQGALFLPYKANQIAATRGLISAWMRLAIFQAMDRNTGSDGSSMSTWFVVDELDALGPIDGLKDALARIRKFGGRCVLGFQSIAQVSSTYGAGDAHTIVENCGNSLILRCSASEGGGTARFVSQLIGEREVLSQSVSRTRRFSELLGSVSRSEHLSIEPAVLASEIEQLPDLEGYLKHASQPGWRRVQFGTRIREHKAPGLDAQFGREIAREYDR